jgi:predicted RNase H-like HicB family nuclease
MQLETINSAKITWTIYPAQSWHEETYCADGDGLIEVCKRISGVYYVTTEFSEAPEGVYETLEEALAKGEELLLKYFPEVYEESRHWE